jgi:hypothetical protein
MLLKVLTPLVVPDTPPILYLVYISMTRTDFTQKLEAAKEVQVHHLSSLGGWNDVLSMM